MKQIKKIFIFLFVAFAFLITSVQAITTNTTSGTIDPNSKLITDTGAVTVTGVTAGDTFQAYKILDAFYNATTNVITYEFTSDFKAFMTASNVTISVDVYMTLTNGNILNGSTVTTSSLDGLISGYANYIRTNSVSGSAVTVSGTTATATVPSGSWLILPTSTNNVYAVMVGNVAYKANSGVWQLEGTTIVAKKSTPGVVAKSVKENGTTSASYSMGEEYSYILTGTVPVYPTNALNRKYIMTDTMATGITFKGLSDVVIQDGTTTLTNTNGTFKNSSNQVVATATISGQVLTITFSPQYLASTSVTVTYKASLNQNATLGDEGNANSVVLEYSNDPYGTGSVTNDPVVTTVKTYGLEIHLADASDSTVKLEGAQFNICADANCTEVLDTITTNAQGIAKSSADKALAAGTYYVKEIKAPTGYILPTNNTSVPISVTGAVAGDPGYYKVELANTQAGVLPFTGGMGTLFYTLFGLLVILIAAYVYVNYRKSNKEISEM